MIRFISSCTLRQWPLLLEPRLTSFTIETISIFRNSWINSVMLRDGTGILLLRLLKSGFLESLRMKRLRFTKHGSFSHEERSYMPTMDCRRSS